MHPADIQFQISDRLFLEMILMNIRGKTISFAAGKKRENKQAERNLEFKIREIEERMHLQHSTIDDTEIDILRSYKQALETLRSEKIKGNILRSKAQWIESGEKPTQFFLNLENKNYTNKTIPKIVLENGEEIVSQEKILQTQKDFYAKLYSKNDNEENDNDTPTNLQDLPHPKLDKKTSESLEGRMTLTELSQALKSMKNEKKSGYRYRWIYCRIV